MFWTFKRGKIQFLQKFQENGLISEKILEKLTQDTLFYSYEQSLTLKNVRSCRYLKFNVNG